jgi:predicted nucleic acid-binding protein
VTRVVVDASAWLELVCGQDRWESVSDLVGSEVQLHVPALCDVEVVSGLRKLVLRGPFAAPAAEQALQNYRALAPRRHPHEPLMTRMLELRDVLSAYDATYVALAEGLDARLATLDRSLARTAFGDLGLKPALPVD